MGKLRFAAVVFLAIVLMVPPGAALAEVQVPEKAAVAAFLPSKGTWTGRTNFGYPVSFTVNSTGTAWSNFSAAFKVTIGTCSTVVRSTVAGPANISANQFKWTGTPLSFTGTFTSATTATGTFAWRNPVQECGNKIGSQSGTWSAKAPVAAPGAFSKVSPANASVNQRVYPTLSWNASVGATSYEYCIAATLIAPCGGVFKTTGTSRSVTVGPLSQNTTYYWQVRARNSGGVTPANGVWWSFKTGILPGAFSKSSPLNGSTKQPLASLLKWTASTGAANYLYCFDTVNDNQCNTKWVSAGKVTSIDPPGVFLPGKTYYWQVLAATSAGTVPANGGAWWSFSTVPPAQLVLPSIGGQDGWILESTETSGVGGTMNVTGPTFALGDDALNRQYRAILSFNTKNLPSGAVLVGVTLRIRRYAVTPSNPFATLGNILGDIKQGTFGAGGLELSDFQATASRQPALMIKNTPVNGWYAGSLGAPSFPYINRLGYTQFRLRFAMDDNNNRRGDYMTFYSGNVGPLNYPRLILLYYVP